MGIYIYTRRKDVKITEDGIEMVRFDYAYKEGSSRFFDDGAMNRKIAILHSHAERATDATSHVQYGIMGAWVHAEEKEGVPVFAIDYKNWIICDSQLPKIVGTLHKKGRKLWIDFD